MQNCVSVNEIGEYAHREGIILTGHRIEQS